VDLTWQVPMELADVIAMSLLLVFEWSLCLGEVSMDQRKATVILIFKKGKE